MVCRYSRGCQSCHIFCSTVKLQTWFGSYLALRHQSLAPNASVSPGAVERTQEKRGVIDQLEGRSFETYPVIFKLLRAQIVVAGKQIQRNEMVQYAGIAMGRHTLEHVSVEIPPGRKKRQKSIRLNQK